MIDLLRNFEAVEALLAEVPVPAAARVERTIPTPRAIGDVRAAVPAEVGADPALRLVERGRPFPRARAGDALHALRGRRAIGPVQLPTRLMPEIRSEHTFLLLAWIRDAYVKKILP